MRTTLRTHVSIALLLLPIAWFTTSGAAQTLPAHGFKISTYAGLAGTPGSEDGTLTTARFDNPTGIAIDNSGNLFLVEENNNTVRKITPAGMVSTIAGLAGVAGIDDGPGGAARFSQPHGIAVAGDGTLYVADTANSTIRKITPEGVVTTIAGLAGAIGSTDGPGATARFNQPWGIAVDGSGNVFVADTFNSTIRKIAPDGKVSTFAGVALAAGTRDGPALDAQFFLPTGLAFGPDGTLYVGDEENHTIRKISTTGDVSTLAGMPGVSGFADGQGAAARFNETEDITVDAGGNVYVVDEANRLLRRITPSGVVTTIAGQPGATGRTDGIGAGATLGEVEAIAVDRAGRLYLADVDADTIRMAVRQELVDNGDLQLGNSGWNATAESDMVWDASGGVLRFHVSSPAVTDPTAPPRAAVFQQTNMPMASDAPIVAQFDLGNSANMRRRLNMYIADGNMTDLAVCAFWLAPNAPMRTYQVRTHTTAAWRNATVMFAPATENDTADGDYLVDSISLRDGPASQSLTRTDCVDPTAPTIAGGSSSPSLLVNTSFDDGLLPWMVYGDSTNRINAGVFEFIRPGTPDTPAGVVLQHTNATMNVNQVLTATLQLGNSSTERKRVAVLVHDSDFSDLSVCTFWIPPGQPVSSYTMQSFASKAWRNATVSVYTATIGTEPWIRLDNVTLQRTSSQTTVGTQCFEPDDPPSSGVVRPLVPPPWQEVFDWPDIWRRTEVNVRSYGARGDGVTDDAAAFQAALDAAEEARPGLVRVPGGPDVIYRIGTTLRWPGGVAIVGEGAVLKLTDNFEAASRHTILQADDVNDLAVFGLTFDGNYTALVAHSTTLYATAAIRVSHATRVRIERCQFQNYIGKGGYIHILGNAHGGNASVSIIGNTLTGGGIPASSYPLDHIYVQETTSLVVRDNTLIDWSDTGIGLEHGGTDYFVTGNRCVTRTASANDAIVFAGNGNASNILIAGNYLAGGSFGIAFREMLGPNGYTIQGVRITNNLIDGYAIRGISLKGLSESDPTIQRQIRDVVVSGNLIRNPDPTINVGIGIVIDDYVNDVLVTNNVVQESRTFGIAVVRDHDNSETRIGITNNWIWHPGLRASADVDSSAIYVTSAFVLDGLSIEQNMISGDGAKMTYGIYLRASDFLRTKVADNLISGMAGGFASIATVRIRPPLSSAVAATWIDVSRTQWAQ